MSWRCMLLRWRYFIILEGAKTQKTVTDRFYRYYANVPMPVVISYRLYSTTLQWSENFDSKTNNRKKFHSVLLIVVTRDNECTRLPVSNCKRANMYCTTEPKWAKVCRLPRWILHTAVWSILHDLMASMKTERLIRTDAMFQSGDE